MVMLLLRKALKKPQMVQPMQIGRLKLELFFRLLQEVDTVASSENPLRRVEVSISGIQPMTQLQKLRVQLVTVYIFRFEGIVMNG